jgi:antitoxin component HigA of HigAB toxin-antitoxin module
MNAPSSITSEAEYRQALARVEALMSTAAATTPEGEELDALATQVEAYEAEHFPIDPPDPEAATKFKEEQSAGSPNPVTPAATADSEVPATPSWRTYEEVAVYLIRKMADELGLGSVDASQLMAGRATSWQLDAKGMCEDDDGFVLIEIRQRSRKINQESAAAIAYRIKDTGARSGIVVSPFGFQSGAQKIAAAENIVSMELDADSTVNQFVLKFLGRVMVGISGQQVTISSGILTPKIG